MPPFLCAPWWVAFQPFPTTTLHRREVTAMPMKPMKPCKYPRCPRLTNGNYCEEHQDLHRGDRESSGKRGYNSRWQKARARYLKVNPLCVECHRNGRLVKATVVDHITPHRGDPVLFWEGCNWQSLCKTCHDKKTWNEDRYPVYRF